MDSPHDKLKFDMEMQDPAAKLVMGELFAMRQRLLDVLGDKAPFHVMVAFRSPFADKSKAFYQIKATQRELPDLLVAQANLLGTAMEEFGLKLTEKTEAAS